MTDLPIPSTREEAFLWIAASALFGHLGLFVGTGFSRAASADIAPSFEGLLQVLATRLDLSKDFVGSAEFRHKSLPQIASQLQHELSRPSRG